MKAEKDKNTGKWLIQFRYTNWQGERKKTTKRGFNTKREAEEWVRNFLMSQQADFNMNFVLILPCHFVNPPCTLYQAYPKELSAYRDKHGHIH